MQNGSKTTSSQCRATREDERSSVQDLLAGLKTCSRTLNLKWGMQLHADAVELGRLSDVYVGSALINMYAKCSRLTDAQQVFDRLQQPDVVSWNVLIMGYAENGQGVTALQLFTRMKTRGPAPSCVSLVAALKACTSIAVKNGASNWGACRNWGKTLHNLAVENGCGTDIKVQNTLIDMFAKCRSMADAHRTFDNMKQPNVVSWTVLILGYAENGQGFKSLDLFTKMKVGGLAPDSVTFVAALKACISCLEEGSSGLEECRKRGEELHHLIVENSYDSNVYVQRTLIEMYAKCGSMLHARKLFDGMKHPDVMSWNSLIMGYATNGEARAAIDLFGRMTFGGPAPDALTFLAAVKACTSLAASGCLECREWGRDIHELAMQHGVVSNIYLLNTLIDMYAKCNSMVDAQRVFDSLKQQELVSWTVLIMGYADNGQSRTALDLFRRMKDEGLAPDSITFVAVLKACGLVGGLEFGRTIHAEMNRAKIELDVILVTCLVDFYVKCGSLVEAQSVFDSHAETRNIRTWTALLSGYSSCGDHESVFSLFEAMPERPNTVTFLCILLCCSHSGLVEKGQRCFETMSPKHGILPTVEHYTCMIDILGRAKRLDDAMALLERMPCSPNDVTWTIILSSCRRWKNANLGKLAFQSLMSFNDGDAAGYVVMGQIYRSKGMLREQEMLLGMRRKLEAWKKTGQSSWTDEQGEVHTLCGS